MISFTNHALDQFLEDLMQFSIKASDMVRLGGKSTPKTASLLLSEQSNSHRLSPETRASIDQCREDGKDIAEQLRHTFSNFIRHRTSFDDLLDYLEFSEESNDVKCYSAFQVPLEADGWKTQGRGQKEIDADYLFRRWQKGQDPGIFAERKLRQDKFAWELSRLERNRLHDKWYHKIAEEKSEKIRELAKMYKGTQETIESHLDEGKIELLRKKRIIGCTTTAAAKYNRLITAAQPDIIIVEEAGEILESHVLTALTPSVKQLVLIGDHKQLRPKINNYALSVEKGDGFDLNRSLFERLILQGYPHTVLQKQHRMHPDISVLIKELIYPELQDSDDTLNRPTVRGFEDRVIFMNHSHAEVDNNAISDRRDQDSKSSKENVFEADMVLKLVKYLGQQGYGTKHIVVLTPYLGQLRLLRDKLSDEVDPWLSDLESFDLIRAGQLSDAAASVGKSQLRLSTIDNYQGEESDIVIVSLTRSNSRGDVGFLAAPERLNVLLSRARNSVFLFGNMETFMQSKKGQHVWVPFFKSMKEKGHLYDGVPVRCEQHPEHRSLLREPLDFDKFCPEGGCTEPWQVRPILQPTIFILSPKKYMLTSISGVLLGCKAHTCNLKCHRVSDHTGMLCSELVEVFCSDQNHSSWVPCYRKHKRLECQTLVEMMCGAQQHRCQVACGKRNSRIECQELVNVSCPQKHPRKVKCWRKDEPVVCHRLIDIICDRQHTRRVPCSKKNDSSCEQCIEEDAEVERKAVRDLDLERKKRALRENYKQDLARIQDRIDHNRAIIKERQENDKRTRTLNQRRDELAALEQTVTRIQNQKERSAAHRTNVQVPAPMPGTRLNDDSSSSTASQHAAPSSQAKDEWEDLKKHEGAKSKPLDELMGMIGLEEVKSAFLSIKSRVDTAIRQGINLDQERFSCSMLGNPGTGMPISPCLLVVFAS